MARKDNSNGQRGNKESGTPEIRQTNDILDDVVELDNLLGEILAETSDEDEQLQAFCSFFKGNVNLPADAFIIGEPVSVIGIDYDGNIRRGLTATTRREDGSEFLISAVDLVFTTDSNGGRYIAAYRRWLAIEPYPTETRAPLGHKRQHKANSDDLDLSGSIELVALSVKKSAIRCRLLGSARIITFRTGQAWDVVPGEIITVQPGKQWRYGGHPFLSGEIESTRLDAAALGLVPLGLEDMGMWNPKKHYWGEENEAIAEWASLIIAHGLRPAFIMEQVLPGADPDDPFADPINQSNDFKESGECPEAKKILMDLCQADLRCLDAHVHLGNILFDHWPQSAIRHYEVGKRIGELSLGIDFDGVLEWGHIDNRPFLRCLHGFGLCLWALGRIDEAKLIFERMLWLNPTDNQGVRFLMEDLRKGKTLAESQDEY